MNFAMSGGFPTFLNEWRFLKRPRVGSNLNLHVLPPLVPTCTFYRHTSPSGRTTQTYLNTETHDYPPYIVTKRGYNRTLRRKKGGHRHLTGDRPFNKADRVRATLLAHIGSANGSLLTIDRVEQTLAQANVLGRDLD